MQSIIDKNESLQVSVSHKIIIEKRDKIFNTNECIISLKRKS
jgi:GTP-sensing pleiotropic transcriptional regulator CodY